MSTIVLICSCDSIVSTMCEKLCVCSARVLEPSTNCADVSMVGNICTCIEQIFLIGVVGCLLWKLIDHISQGISGWRRRVWEEEDMDRKTEFDLLERYLDFLKKQTEVKKDEPQNESVIIQYGQVLRKLIDSWHDDKKSYKDVFNKEK